ncbi:hypothetical protein B0H11DRAFT_2269169 [Mycena galericulata]|nr:hypothetical protein B0H11DRAFT_2269169 [Mycena galericulata]
MSTHHQDSHPPPGYEYTEIAGKNGHFRVTVCPDEPNDGSESRYVYYRVYAMDGALRSQKPYGYNPYLGRIKATSVPPPHTSASLKRVLVQVEALPDPTGRLTGLFQTKDARTVLAPNGRVDILTRTGGIGETAQTAVALVFFSATKETLNTPSTNEAVDAEDDDLPYLYYRLYNPGGEEKSVRSFNKREPALGRIKRDSIAPPRNALSVKRRIATVEGKTIYGFADLFPDLKAKKAYSSNAVVADTAGANEDDPISLVQPERHPELDNTPVLVVEAPKRSDYTRQERPTNGARFPLMSTHRIDSQSPPPSYQDISTPGKNGNFRVSLDEPNDLRQSRNSELRYVYYRVYAVDGALPCQNPCGHSPYLGRIEAKSVPPPHTSASLKRMLVQVEALPDPTGELTGLFRTKDARTVLATNEYLEILTGDIGETAQKAVALVFLTAPKKPLNTPSTDEAVRANDDDDVPYLYYRLYHPGGEEKSVRSFDAAEYSLGRVKRSTISPPRNVLSVKRRITKVEAKTIYGLADLFTDLKAKKAYSYDAVVADTAGASKDDPISLVQPECRPELYNIPVQVLEVPKRSGSTRQERPTNDFQWLSPSPGDILHTDGIGRSKYVGSRMPHAFTAVDKDGKKGYISVHPDHSKLLDEEPIISSGCSIQ